ncbi:MAG TPA: DUF6285 domain-containing protein [Roseiflexaceae bacterium]|jgi:hypothetical protein
MQDQPSALELIAAVREYLQNEIVPALDDHRLRFRTLVAANVLGIVERELPQEAALLREEWIRLVALDDPLHPAVAVPADLAALREDVRARSATLCERIRAGEADEGPWRAAVFAHARRCVEEKLRVNNPKYLERVKG